MHIGIVPEYGQVFGPPGGGRRRHECDLRGRKSGRLFPGRGTDPHLSGCEVQRGRAVPAATEQGEAARKGEFLGGSH